MEAVLPQHNTTISTWLWGSLLLALMLQLVEVKSNAEIDALISFKNSLVSPEQAYDTWDPTLATPCTWVHIKCNSDNRVVQVLLGNEGLLGELPVGLAALEQLERLILYKNNIKGPIPADIGNLKNLQALDLRSNSISGSIPPSLGNLQSLTYLGLGDNELSGQVPNEIGNLLNLKHLEISSNKLCGFLPIGLLHVPTISFSYNSGVGKPCP